MKNVDLDQLTGTHSQIWSTGNPRRGEYIGEIAFLDKGLHSADAEAKTDCELYVLLRDEFNAQVHKDAV